MKISHEKFEEVKTKAKEVINKAIDKPVKTALLIGVTGSAVAKIVAALKGNK